MVEEKLNKAIIFPIVSGFLFYLKTILQVELPTEALDITVEMIIGLVGLSGIFMKLKKKKVVKKKKPPSM